MSHQCNNQGRGIQEPVFSYWSCQEKDLHLGQRNLVTPGFSSATLTLTVSFQTYCSIKTATCAIRPRPVLQAIFFHSFTPEQLPLFISVSRISHSKSEHGVLCHKLHEISRDTNHAGPVKYCWGQSQCKKLHILSLKNTLSHNPEEDLPVSSLAFYGCRCWGNNRDSHLPFPTFP